jgi:hypothetical protein
MNTYRGNQIQHALIQNTAQTMVEELIKFGISIDTLTDLQRGQIVCKWLSEGDNISDSGEVYDGISTEHMTLFYAYMGKRDTISAARIWLIAVGQAPYSGTVLSSLEQKAKEYFDEIARCRYEPDDFDALKAKRDAV